MTLNPFLCTDLSISDSLRSVRKSVLIYEAIITIMHKDLHRKVSYQYLIRLEAYKLIKHLIGEKEYEGFKMWW